MLYLKFEELEKNLKLNFARILFDLFTWFVCQSVSKTLDEKETIWTNGLSINNVKVLGGRVQRFCDISLELLSFENMSNL